MQNQNTQFFMFLGSREKHAVGFSFDHIEKYPTTEKGFQGNQRVEPGMILYHKSLYMFFFNSKDFFSRLFR